MADLLIDAHQHAQAARAAGETHLDEHVLTDLRRRYLGAYTAGIRDNHNRCGPLAKDAAALARRGTTTAGRGRARAPARRAGAQPPAPRPSCPARTRG